MARPPASIVLLTLTSALLGAIPSLATAQSGRQALVIVNAADPESVRIGDAYARSREVPADQIIKLTVSAREEISRPDYTNAIERPLRVWLTQHAAQDRILYLVLAKGVPLRITGSGGLQGTGASVDSELTLLYRKMTGGAAPVQGRLANPYFLGMRGIETARPFSHEALDVFLVTRLDGFTTADVLGLITRGRTPSSRGSFVLDMKGMLLPGSSERANAWLQTAADRLTAMGYGDRVVLDTTSKVVTGETHVLGYYSWGSNDPAIRQRTFDLEFVPGALAAMFVSTDGRTFGAPPDGWQVGSWADKSTYFAGSPQSLAGDLIHAGVTGIAAHVGEPYLDATIRPEVLFPAYASGFTLAEAYYLAMPYLSWQTVVIGDPLCAPFPRQGPGATSLEPPIDPVTELPAFFGARRLAALAGESPGAQPEALRLLLRGETLLVRTDKTGARQAFEQAIARDPAVKGAQLALASLYEEAQEYDKAVERYRQVLSRAPNDLIALNNLAFALAVRQAKPDEALPLAERAYTLSRGAPLIADTLGWIHHLAGDRQQALRYLQQASAGLAGQAEIRWHYAVALAAVGEHARAAKELAAALQIDPALSLRDEVATLQKTLAATPVSR